MKDPWVLNEGPYHATIDNETVGTLVEAYFSEDEDGSDAELNAEHRCAVHLMYAAPELLEALQRLLPLAEDDVSQYGDDADTDEDILFARAAIAKATGELP